MDPYQRRTRKQTTDSASFHSLGSKGSKPLKNPNSTKKATTAPPDIHSPPKFQPNQVVIIDRERCVIEKYINTTGLKKYFYHPQHNPKKTLITTEEKITTTSTATTDNHYPPFEEERMTTARIKRLSVLEKKLPPPFASRPEEIPTFLLRKFLTDVETKEYLYLCRLAKEFLATDPESELERNNDVISVSESQNGEISVDVQWRDPKAEEDVQENEKEDPFHATDYKSEENTSYKEDSTSKVYDSANIPLNQTELVERKRDLESKIMQNYYEHWSPSLEEIKPLELPNWFLDPDEVKELSQIKDLLRKPRSTTPDRPNRLSPTYKSKYGIHPKGNHYIKNDLVLYIGPINTFKNLTVKVQSFYTSAPSFEYIVCTIDDPQYFQAREEELLPIVTPSEIAFNLVDFPFGDSLLLLSESSLVLSESSLLESSSSSSSSLYLSTAFCLSDRSLPQYFHTWRLCPQK